MVRPVLFCAVMLALGSCSGTPESSAEDAVFDVSPFELDVFTGRVQDFLESREETRSLRKYKALFVNTESCSACMKSAFEGISPYLSIVDERVFIYCNDSSILQIAPENKNLQFVCLPAETFRSAQIFHGKMYLYSVYDREIVPLSLTPRETDSLNNLNNQTINNPEVGPA
jgi:hypothetical protein